MSPVTWIDHQKTVAVYCLQATFAQRAAENIIARKKQEKPYVTYDHTIVYLEGSIGAKDKLARYTNHRPDISIDKSACADRKNVAVRTVAEHSATPAKE